MDTVIPVVFPDYRIAVVEKDIPVDILPWFTFDDFFIPKMKVPELGHAGVLFFSAAGVTKYYEYGRYDKENLGIVRRIRLPNLRIKDDKPTDESLKKVLSVITKASGQGGRIEGVYIEVKGKYGAMLRYAKLQQKQNTNRNRRPYDITTNSCIHFVKKVVEAAGVSTPWMFDPRPNSYIGEFRDDFPDLDFNAKTKSMRIGK